MRGRYSPVFFLQWDRSTLKLWPCVCVTSHFMFYAVILATGAILTLSKTRPSTFSEPQVCFLLAPLLAHVRAKAHARLLFARAPIRPLPRYCLPLRASRTLDRPDVTTPRWASTRWATPVSSSFQPAAEPFGEMLTMRP